MTIRQTGAAFQDYLNMYGELYGPHVVEHRLLTGRDTIGVFLVDQPPGHYPDAPTETVNLQMGLGPDIRATVDLGAGQIETVMRRNDFVVSPDHTPTDYQVHTDARMLCLGIPTGYLSSAADALGLRDFDMDPLLRGVQDDRIVSEIIRECWQEAESGQTHGALYADAAMMTLAIRLFALSGVGPKRARTSVRAALDDAAFARVADFVDANLDSALRMQALADLAGLPVHTFARAFKARTGRPPYQWVIDRRVERARELLTGTDLPLASVAYACGFSSQAHMTTLVGERLGLSPGRLREISE